jgi:dienelactone hydrolase
MIFSNGIFVRSKQPAMIKTAGIVLLLSLVFLSGSCKKKDALDGIDKTALFALPTTAELNAAQTAWQKRDLTPLDVTIEETHAINNKLALKLISFRLYGYKQYAGVLLPVTSKPLPVQLFISGFSLNEPLSYKSIKTSSSDTASLPFIYIVPALRGQSLTLWVNDISYTTPVSEGTRNDAFDGATDDAIACLNAVAIAFKEADATKVMVRGGSRGGTVALLMAERDKRVKLAAAVAFPADLIGLTEAHQRDATYEFQFLNALINKSATLEETRIKMIASSPLYFCRQLPKTQIHFGGKDDITPAKQGEMIFNAMKKLALEDSIEFYLYKDLTHYNISNNAEMEERINTFFHQLY